VDFLVRGRLIAYRSCRHVDDRALGESTSILVKGPFNNCMDPRGFAETAGLIEGSTVYLIRVPNPKKLYLLLPRRKLYIADRCIDIRRDVVRIWTLTVLAEASNESEKDREERTGKSKEIRAFVISKLVALFHQKTRKSNLLRVSYLFIIVVSLTRVLERVRFQIKKHGRANDFRFHSRRTAGETLGVSRG